MSADKKSLVLYHDIRTPLELLSDEERGKLFMAILDYSEFGAQPDFDGALRMAFAFIQTAIDRDAEAWEKKREKRKEAGSKGGKQRVANQANATFAKQIKQSQANQAANVPANVNVHAIESNAGKPPRTRFVPPTIEQVRAYCQQRGNVVDAQRFVDYYTANGWKVGKNSMQDWKAAVRTWEAGRQQERQPAQQQADLSWRDSRSPTLDDLVEYPEGSGQYRPRWEVPHD